MKRIFGNFLCMALTVCATASISAAVPVSGPAVADGDEAKIMLSQEQRLGGLPANILNGSRITSGLWVDNGFNFSVRFCDNSVRKMSYRIGSGLSDQRIAEPEAVKNDAKDALVERFRATMQRYEKSAETKVQRLVVSPDLAKVAFVMENNMYVYDDAKATVHQLTNNASDVKKHGFASWVYYEEILGRPSDYIAFWWSPDSRRLAWYYFDETDVPMFPIIDFDGQYGKVNRTRYPKAGTANPKVSIFIVDVSDITSQVPLKKVMADFNCEDDQYFGIPFWNADGSRFIVPWMPREQNELLLYTVNPQTGSKESIYHEKQKTWIDWMEDMQFTTDGFYVIRDTDGWQNIYFQSFDGKVFRKITEGRNWSTQFIKVDVKGGYIYFSARKESSLRHDFYKVALKGVGVNRDGSFRAGKITRLTSGEYDWTDIRLSPDNRHFSAVRSNCNTPHQLVVSTCDGKANEKLVWDCKGEDYDRYLLPRQEILTIDVDGYTIPARVIWPVNMEEGKKYPVIIDMYGGPDAGTVFDQFNAAPKNGSWASSLWWAYDGFIRICIDHRASGHCGKEGLNFLHRNLLNIEFKDYVKWVEKLYEYPCVDRNKIGITGFSYGGSMTTIAVTQYSRYFKYGIAGGGVYDYELYDTHYTERYMDHPADNVAGYDNTEAAKRFANYKGDSTNYLKITHGTSDDNVHIQNTMHLIKALQYAGKQFDLMLYPGEYHGYRGLAGAHSRKADIIFWYRHLKGQEAPEALLNSIR